MKPKFALCFVGATVAMTNLLLNPDGGGSMLEQVEDDAVGRASAVAMASSAGQANPAETRTVETTDAAGFTEESWEDPDAGFDDGGLVEAGFVEAEPNVVEGGAFEPEL